MLDHIRKHQEEINNNIRKSFMGDGGAGAAGTGQNGFEYSETKDKDVEKSGMKKTMDEWKDGSLHTGSGAVVTDQKQAEAIGLSEEDKKKKDKEKDKKVEKGDEGEAGVVAETEEFDDKKDKTKLKDVNLVKSQVDYLSEGLGMKQQQARILASYGIDIQKSKSGKGEGSRGGKVIGHTSSGKAVYDNHDHSSHQSFSSADHKEAAAMHQKRGELHGQKGLIGTSNKHFDAAAHHETEAEKKDVKSAEWEHGVKKNDTVRHEGKDKKVIQVAGNHLTFEDGSAAHVSKTFNKEGKSHGRDKSEDKK